MSKEQVQKIKLNGLDFILTTPNDDDSPITTIDTYKRGECGYAHLYRNANKIMRFRQQIGTIENIEFGEMIEIEIDNAEFATGLLGSSWPS